MEIKKIFLPLIIIITIISCTNKFKAPDNSVDPNNQKFSDTSYVQQFPVWTGFNKPQDIIIGKETFVYVADTYNDRIVMMNVAGQILGTKSVKRPVASITYSTPNSFHGRSARFLTAWIHFVSLPLTTKISSSATSGLLFLVVISPWNLPCVESYFN